MHDLSPIVLVLLVAVLAVTACRSLRVPPMLGYLVVGFIAGPGVMHLIPEGPETEFLGEIGIVFMMFSIGLEFSLSKLRAMQRLVFGVGGSQVALTMLVIGIIVWWLSGSGLAGFAVGGALALSSTAIVLKLLSERVEMAQQHGQLAVGVLLFQDLAVVPLLILLPAFAANSDQLGMDLGLALLKVIIVMSLLLVFGQRLMRPWFHMVASKRSSELFMINVLLVTLGIAYLTQLAGLSLALGAFVAGMLISETEYRYQVEEDIKPFRDILLGFFFVTVGMKLDIGVLVEQSGSIMVMLLLLLPVKIIVIFLLARAFGHRAKDSLKGALALAQGSEFGFVLLALSGSLGLISNSVHQSALAAIVLSMLLAPFLIQYADRICKLVIREDWAQQSVDLHQILVQTMAKDEHVIICGYGRSGQSLARLLEAEGISFFALDLDPERVREASEAGDPVVFGDAAKREVLMAAGAMRAKTVVITFADTHASERIIHVVHDLRRDLPVIVRTVDDSDVEKLRAAGADEVVAEVMEGSLMLASHALMVLGVPMSRVLRRIRSVREQRYSLFTGFFRGASDDAEGLDDSEQPRLYSIPLIAGASAVGRCIGEFRLDDIAVGIRGIRRGNRRINEFDSAFELEEGDVLVLLGRPAALAQAEIRLLQGD